MQPMAEWEETTLEKITEPVKDTYTPDTGDDRAYIGLEHIEEASLRLNSVGKSSDVTSNKFLFKPNDVLFGKLRPYFRKVVKPNFPGICSTDIWVFRGKKGVDQNYLFYFLANWNFVDIANQGDSGTRMPRADWKFLKDTIWTLPPLPEQEAIAEVLSSLDDKIDLLHRQNKTLESMAETLFRQWFVEEAQEKKMSPLSKLVDVIDNRGKTPEYVNYKTDYPIIEVKSLANDSRFIDYDKCEKFVDKETYETWFRAGHPEVNDVLFSTVGSIAEMAIMIENKGAIAQNVIGLRTKKIPSYYVFQYLSLREVKEQLLNLDIGAVQPSIKVPHLLEIEIPVSDEKKIKRFEAYAIPWYKKMSTNQSQTRTLTQLRDTLLPKLMSGEVRVRM